MSKKRQYEENNASDNKKTKFNIPNINEYDEHGLTPLHKAVIGNSVKEVFELLNKGADIRVTVQNKEMMENEDFDRGERNIHINCHGDNIAHLAMQNGSQNMVGAIAAKDINLFKAKNELNLTPLGSGAASKHFETVEYYLEYIEPSINTLKDDEDDISLEFAIDNGNYKMVKLLLEHGSNPHFTRDQSNSYNPAMVKAAEGSTDIMEILFKYGVDINAVGYDNNTPLHQIIKYGDDKKNANIEFLLKHGASLDIKNDDGLDPIQMSIGDDISISEEAKVMLSKALAVDLACGGKDIFDYKLENLPKSLFEYVDYDTEHNFMISRINHKIMNHKTTSLKQVMENAEHILNNIKESANKTGLDLGNIHRYLSSFIKDVGFFGEHVNLDEGVPTLFKLSLDSIHKSKEHNKQWEKLKEDLTDHEIAKARILLSSNYLEKAAKQVAINNNAPKISKDIVEKSNLLDHMSDLFKDMNVKLVSHGELEELEAIESEIFDVIMAGEYSSSDEDVA